MGVRSYRDLIVWQKAMDLVLESYRLVQQFPTHERYGLANQLRRAAVSVPANIAEGHGRLHRGDYLHHLSIASGSLVELETHIEIACRLQYVSADDVSFVHDLMNHVGRMMTRLIIRLTPGHLSEFRAAHPEPRAPSPEPRCSG